MQSGRQPTPRPRTAQPFRVALWIVALVALTTGLFSAGDAGAQELYNYSVTVAGGLAGSTDAEPGDGVDNPALQVGFSYVTEKKARLGLRLGRFDLDSDDRFDGLTDASLTYLTVAGEYRFSESFYDSGLFLGLGGYQLDGDAVLPGAEGDETAVGVTVGVTGDFKIRRRLSLIVELAGHYVDFDAANVFASGMVGVAFHFQ